MKLISLGILCFFCEIIFSQTHVSLNKIEHLEIPKTTYYNDIIFHKGYSLLYNEKHEQASWVAYELTKNETIKAFQRTNKFIIDPYVKTGSATNADYIGSGFDKGHLAPAADMSWSEVAMIESFYLSNMSPQLPSFNRGIWKKLEELVRNWAYENESIYVVTGPVLRDSLPTIGESKVSVPEYFYKVILDYSEPDLKGICFLIPNKISNEPLQNYAMSIDSLENLTHIDFYPLLPDSNETLIEKTLCIDCWLWNKNNSSNKNIEPSIITSSQCKGFTKKGNRCKNETKNTSGYCYLHE